MTQSDWEHYFKVLMATILGADPDTIVVHHLDAEGKLISATTTTPADQTSSAYPPDSDGHISFAE